MMEKFLSYIGFMTHNEKEDIQREIKELKMEIGNTRELLEGLKSEIRSLQSAHETRMNQMASESTVYASRSEESLAGLQRLVQQAQQTLEEDRQRDDTANKQMLEHLDSIKLEMHTQQSEITQQIHSLLPVVKELENVMHDTARTTWENITKQGLRPLFDKTLCRADVVQELAPLEELLRLLVASQLMNIATTETKPQSKILKAH